MSYKKRKYKVTVISKKGKGFVQQSWTTNSTKSEMEAWKKRFNRHGGNRRGKKIVRIVHKPNISQVKRVRRITNPFEGFF